MKKICRVRISVYFAVLIACVIALDHSGLAVTALLCAAFHEAGHFIALAIYKIPVEEVAFTIFGIHIRLGRTSSIGYARETGIALAGCAVNLILALVSLPFILNHCFLAQAEIFALMNLLVGGFNLLPVGQLDGGRALEAALCGRFTVTAARRAVDLTSVVFLLPIVYLGLRLVVATGYNFSLILAAGYLAFMLIFKGSLLKIA